MPDIKIPSLSVGPQALPAASGGGAEVMADSAFAALLGRQFGNLAVAPRQMPIPIGAGEEADAPAADAAQWPPAFLLAGGALPAAALDAQPAAETTAALETGAGAVVIAAPMQFSQFVPADRPRSSVTVMPANLAGSLAAVANLPDLPDPIATAPELAKALAATAVPTMAPGSTPIAVAERTAVVTELTLPPAGTDAALMVAGDAQIQAARAHAQAGPANSVAANAAGDVIDVPVGSPGWSHAVADRVVWMAGHGEHRAELSLTPPNMGRVEISITVSGDQATATFVSTHPAVRELLQEALPRLRDMLADVGLNLGQAHVGADSPRQSAQDRQNGDSRPATAKADGIAAPDITGRLPWVGGRGLVDTFA